MKADGRSLLVERYDIPDRGALDYGAQVPLYLQEDGCSLLLLRRDDKYSTSLERISESLVRVGLNAEAMLQFLQLVLCSRLVGNGDLHAKNVSVLHRFRRGRPGEPPLEDGVGLAPFYDLVNTRLHLPGDELALPVDGKRSGLRLSSFARLASRWGMTREEVRTQLDGVVSGIETNLEQVLTVSLLSEEAQDRYRGVVLENTAKIH